MNVVFLDIDGVLNHELYFTKTDTWMRQAELESNNKNVPRGASQICPQSVAILNSIVKRVPDAKWVVSSVWRADLERVKEVLKFHNFSGDIIGKTPHVFFDKTGNDVPRGCEIHLWRMNNSHNGRYVILDDDDDMLYNQRNNFVHVNPFCGITLRDANSAVQILTQ